MKVIAPHRAYVGEGFATHRLTLAPCRFPAECADGAERQAMVQTLQPTQVLSLTTLAPVSLSSVMVSTGQA
jgi:hypothetical protein